MRINTVRLRAMIGWLGMLLPWIVVLLIGNPHSSIFVIVLSLVAVLLLSRKGYEPLGMLPICVAAVLIGYFPPSISATWYTNACTPFMIILGAASILLISYKGYDKVDDILLTCAGVAGLGICLFPCATFAPSDIVGTFLIDKDVSDIVHTVCAIIFFALLSYNSFFLFTKSTGEMTKKKRVRNIIYRVCGVGMLASFLLLLIPNFTIKLWLVETIALFFFGVSFLTKADIYPWLACDTPYEGD